MQGEFIHDYDSQNYLRYVSRDLSGGVYKVVYIDKNFRQNLEDRNPIAMILTESTTPAGARGIIRSFDGCPRVFDHPHPKPDFAAVDFRRIEKQILHAALYGGRIHRWADGATDHEMIKRLVQRVYKLEQRQGILFQAVEKILKRLHWIP